MQTRDHMRNTNRPTRKKVFTSCERSDIEATTDGELTKAITRHFYCYTSHSDGSRFIPAYNHSIRKIHNSALTRPTYTRASTLLKQHPNTLKNPPTSCQTNGTSKPPNSTYYNLPRYKHNTRCTKDTSM